jgi:hypothetical protein
MCLLNCCDERRNAAQAGLLIRFIQLFLAGRHNVPAGQRADRGSRNRTRLGASCSVPLDEDTMTITIFHNPACSTSRKVLHMQLSPRESLRIHEPAYTDLRLDGDLLSNAHR